MEPRKHSTTILKSSMFQSIGLRMVAFIHAVHLEVCPNVERDVDLERKCSDLLHLTWLNEVQ
jgi:hypothetical protein